MGDEEYEDDGNYGSAATLDVEVLQSISKRVHYGSCHTFFIYLGCSHGNQPTQLKKVNIPQGNLSPNPSSCKTQLLSSPTS